MKRNNNFYISDGEECPVNYIDISNLEITNLEGVGNHIINQIYVQESSKTIVSDINHILIWIIIEYAFIF